MNGSKQRLNYRLGLALFLICFVGAGTASIEQHIHPLLFLVVPATIACILALIVS
jgi:hypothetical protein